MFDGRDQRAAVDVGVGRAGVGDLGDGADAADHPGRGERQLGGPPEQRLAGRDGEQVRAELVDLGEQPGLDEAERPSTATIAATPIAIPSADSAGAHAARAQADARDTGEIAGPQLRRASASAVALIALAGAVG